LAALLCPAWPVAALLHDHLVRRLSADLAAHLAEPATATAGGGGGSGKSNKDGEGGDGGRRKDPSHVGFLMDQVGTRQHTHALHLSPLPMRRSLLGTHDHVLRRRHRFSVYL